MGAQASALHSADFDSSEDDKAPVDTDRERLEGIVKSFDKRKSFGFIHCQALRDRGIAQDVFLLKTELGLFGVSSYVSFSLEASEKGPQASDLQEAQPPLIESSSDEVTSCNGGGRAQAFTLHSADVDSSGDDKVSVDTERENLEGRIESFDERKGFIQSL